MNDVIKFSLSPRGFEVAFARLFFGIALALVVADTVFGFTKLVSHSDLNDLVNMGTEHSLNNWFSSQVWLFSAFALMGIAFLSHREGHSIRELVPWLLLAGLFFVLACDDGVAIHERLGTTVEDYFRGKGPVPGKKHEPGVVDQFLVRFGSYTWQVAVLPFYAAAGFGMLKFCWSRLGNTRARRYFIAGIGLMVFAVVLDHFEAKFDLHQGNFWIIPKDWVTHYQRVIEEFAEACAEVCFALCFILHLLTQFTLVRLTFSKAQ